MEAKRLKEEVQTKVDTLQATLRGHTGMSLNYHYCFCNCNLPPLENFPLSSDSQEE